MGRLEKPQKRELPGLGQRIKLDWPSEVDGGVGTQGKAGTREESPQGPEHSGRASGWHGQRFETCAGVRQGPECPHLEEVDKISTEPDRWTGIGSPLWHPLHWLTLSASAPDKVTSSQTGGQGPAW